MRRELSMMEARIAIDEIKIKVANNHRNPEFDLQVSQWLQVFQRNFILYSYLRKFCCQKKSESSQNRSHDLLVKKILYIVYKNHGSTAGKFSNLLRYTIGAEISEYMADIGLKKYDYTIMDIVGLDIMKKFKWDRNYNLTYGFNMSSAEHRLYIRGEPEVIGIETDTPKIVYKDSL